MPHSDRLAGARASAAAAAVGALLGLPATAAARAFVPLGSPEPAVEPAPPPALEPAPPPAVEPAPTPAPAERRGPVTDFSQLSLEELLDTPVTVASRAPAPLREAPGVVTVITHDEIVQMGARDLVDVLQHVPGIQLGVDVEGALGLGVRGLWGTEGKVLFRLDGQELNERFYGTTQLAQHIPVDQIERVEVIRGPGSVIYGGFAELAVVDIWTRGADEVRGASASVSAGAMDGRAGLLHGSLLVGERFDDLALSLGLYGGHDRRSTGRYRDFAGRAYGMAESSALDPRYVNFGASWRDWRLRLIYDDASHETRDAYDDILPRTDRMGFRSTLAAVEYGRALGDTLRLDATAGYKFQSPWRSDERDLDTYYEKTSQKLLAALTLRASLSTALDLVVGVEGFQDRARLDADYLAGTQALFDGRRRTTQEDATALAEVRWAAELATLVAGGRYEWNSAFGGSWVPRAAVMRSFGDAFAKILYSGAFRAPALENTGLNPDVSPERTTVLEAEVGWQVPHRYVVSLNAFQTTIDDPIIFRYDSATDTETYRNFRHTGTRGAELVQRLQGEAGRVDLAWSYYTAAGLNDVPLYEVAGDDDALLGFAQHVVSLRAHAVLGHGASLDPSAVLVGPRYGDLRGDAAGRPVPGREDTALVLNLWANFERLLVPGLNLGMGVFDLLDSGWRWVQPHHSGHAPLPGPGREFVVRLGYELRVD